jgi:hypothetical protein
MKLEQYYECNGNKLLITIESKDLITHSKMQFLSESDLENIKKHLFLSTIYTSEMIVAKTK